MTLSTVEQKDKLELVYVYICIYTYDDTVEKEQQKICTNPYNSSSLT